MSDLASSIQIIQMTRPRITMTDLVAMFNPVPEFEFNEGKKWFYTIKESGSLDDGKTLEGNLICVEANNPIQAEDAAYQGLMESINHFRNYLSAADGEIVAEQVPIH